MYIDWTNGAICWYVVCDCGTSWSHSLIFMGFRRYGTDHNSVPVILDLRVKTSP